MFKYVLVAVSIIGVASAVLAFDDATCIVPVDKTGAAPTSTTYIPTPSYGRDVIYDDQTYNYGDLVCGHNINGGYKTAADFEVYDDWTLEMVRVWLFGSGTGDMLVEVFGDAGDIPDDDDLLYSETVSDGDYTWTATGDYMYGYPVYEVEIPIGGFDISPGTMYWLSLQYQGGVSVFWCAAYLQPEWWDYFALYQGGWMSGSYCGTDSFFELHGSTGPPDEEDPTVTDMYPQDDDFPGGVPPSENVAGCHWQDGDPETNEGIDVDASYFEIYDAGMDLVTGMLDIDDSDLWDVVVDFEGDDPWEEGITYTVETETYDLAGNSANETWYFTTGYTNVAPASLGVIKAGYTE